MWKCPVCTKNNTTLLCSECGFDGSMDYEHYPTFGMVSGKAISVRRKLYASSKRPFTKCDHCAGTLFRFDPERLELQCDQCGNIQPLPARSAPVKKRIAPQTGMQAVKAATAGLRFDGLYQSSDNDSNYYLRFFPDGIAVGVSSTGDAAAVSRWLDKSHVYSSKGEYNVTGNRISFSLKSSYGIVSYDGILTVNGLELNVHSHINGHRSFRKYTFVQI